MPDEQQSDPIANTQMFRRFAQQPEPAAARSRLPLTVTLVVLVLVLAGVVVFLASR